MKILAIDTSTSVMGIALMDEKKVYAEVSTNLKINHSIRLMPAIDQMFTEVNWLPSDIDLIAVAKGPGSYTGVRIGVTTAKTFAWSLNVPLVGISTLEAMAYSHSHFGGLLSPLLDARRGQVYTGLYKNNDNKNSIIESERIILLTDWLNIITKKNQEILFVGDDIEVHKDLLKSIGSVAKFSEQAFNIPRASIIGNIALNKYENGFSEDIFSFAPTYLQLAEAEKKLMDKK